MILLAVFAVVLTSLVGYLAWSTWRLHGTPSDLRGDWWPQFEREFRAYADRAGRRASRGTRRRRR